MRRRTATPDYLKECMGDALLELMREKPLEKITIEEMTAKADVGRSTYFRYFKTKEEVLSFKVLAMYRRFSQDLHISHDDAHRLLFLLARYPGDRGAGHFHRTSARPLFRL